LHRQSLLEQRGSGVQVLAHGLMLLPALLLLHLLPTGEYQSLRDIWGSCWLHTADCGWLLGRA
jgi:hypothetical protein